MQQVSPSILEYGHHLWLVQLLGFGLDGTWAAPPWIDLVGQHFLPFNQCGLDKLLPFKCS